MLSARSLPRSQSTASGRLAWPCSPCEGRSRQRTLRAVRPGAERALRVASLGPRPLEMGAARVEPDRLERVHTHSTLAGRHARVRVPTGELEPPPSAMGATPIEARPCRFHPPAFDA